MVSFLLAAFLFLTPGLSEKHARFPDNAPAVSDVKPGKYRTTADTKFYIDDEQVTAEYFVGQKDKLVVTEIEADGDLILVIKARTRGKQPTTPGGTR